jgi:sugar phosphate isomerase/epimerase
MLLSTQTSNTVSRFGFEKGIRVLKDAGFDCLDYSMFGMRKPDDPLCGDNWRELAEEMKKTADAVGIGFNQSHAPFSFRWQDKEVEMNFARPMVERSIEISGILGVDTCIVHPLHWFEYKGHEEEARQLNLDYYRGLIPVARNAGVRVCIENMWQTELKRRCIGDDVGSRGADLASYVDEIDSEWIVACLDIGHSGLVGEEPQDAIRALGGRLKALHVHDNDYVSDRHTLPFLGRIDWTQVTAALRDVAYDGVFTYEADNFISRFPDDYVFEALKFMEKTGRYLISLI